MGLRRPGVTARRPPGPPRSCSPWAVRLSVVPRQCRGLVTGTEYCPPRQCRGLSVAPPAMPGACYRYATCFRFRMTFLGVAPRKSETPIIEAAAAQPTRQSSPLRARGRPRGRCGECAAGKTARRAYAVSILTNANSTGQPSGTGRPAGEGSVQASAVGAAGPGG